MSNETPYGPVDPTQPKDPVAVELGRPGTVTIAGFLMLLGAILGIVTGLSLLVAAADVVQRFRDRAAGTEATAKDIDTVAAAIRSVFIAGGLLTLLLAVVVALLAFGVLRGNNASRITTLVFLAVGLCCGIGGMSFTALGRNANWTINVSNADERLANQIGQAYSDAIPSWLVGTSGGLTDLQALCYVIVAVLLLLPASNAFFRRQRAAAMLPPTVPPTAPPSAGPPSAYPQSGHPPADMAPPPPPPSYQPPPEPPYPPPQPPGQDPNM
jgi:hypothetical protein